MKKILRDIALLFPPIARLADRAGNLQIELDTALTRCEILSIERNAAITQCNNLAVERDVAITHRAAAALERDQLNDEKNNIIRMIFGDGTISREYLSYNYWAAHPRYNFFKSLPGNATLLDIGAGSGGTAVWREWGNPHRRDIRLFGFDLPPNESNHAWDATYSHFYEKWQHGNLETTPLDFDDGFFDGAMASNVLEHLQQPFQVLKSVFNKLKPGARVYIEIPTVASKILPTSAELAAHGMPVMVGNFYDDNTHIETYSLTTFAKIARSIGFIVDEGGAIRHPFLEEDMLRYGLAYNDSELLLQGYWSITGWIQYIILRRCYEPEMLTGSVREMVGDRSPGYDLWIET